MNIDKVLERKLKKTFLEINFSDQKMGFFASQLLTFLGPFHRLLKFMKVFVATGKFEGNFFISLDNFISLKIKFDGLIKKPHFLSVFSNTIQNLKAFRS